MTAFLEQLCAANSETTGARHPRCRTAPSHDSTTTRHMSRANMAGDAEDACYGSDTCPYGGDASCSRSAPARVSRSVCRLLCKSKRGHARAASHPCLYQPPEHTIHSGAPADEHLACISLTCSVCARKCRRNKSSSLTQVGVFRFIQLHSHSSPTPSLLKSQGRQAGTASHLLPLRLSYHVPTSEEPQGSHKP